MTDEKIKTECGEQPDKSEAKKSVSSKRIILSLGAVIALLGCSALFGNYILNGLMGRINIIFVLIMAVSGCVILATLIRDIYLSGEKPVIGRYAMCSVLALNSFMIPELIMDAPPLKRTVLFFLLGYLLSLLPYILGSIIFSKQKVWNIIVALFFNLYAFMQYYVYQFRGDPIKFSDFSSIRSALEIEGQYSFTPQLLPIFCIVDFIIIAAFIIFTDVTPVCAKSRIISSAVFSAGVAVMIFVGGYSFDEGVKNRYITLNFSGEENCYTYRCVGFNLMLYFDGMYNRVEEPENYSHEKADEILSGYTVEAADKKPVIIGIMNESFADFSHISDFDVNADYMPNYRRLCEEGISGYVTVSAYGGYSCNSEYEFLSGNSMYYLPSGSAVFTQYLRSPQESIVSYLNSLGYLTQAVTPCTPDLWNIGESYENLGFSDSVFSCLSGESGLSYVNGNNSDRDLFRKIEKLYEERDKSKPLFMWTTTMQNHGPYEGLEDPAGGVELEDIDCPEAEVFLSSIKLSDEAVGELIDYFRSEEEEVVIVMFGDHYPHIMDFTRQLYGCSVEELSVEDYSRLHQTPFLIWSNKGLKSEKIGDISLNYLSNEVFKAAGLPLSEYQQSLEDIRADIPVISGFGYETSDGKWHGPGESSDFGDTMNRYHILEYDRMFGEKKQ